MTRFLQTAITLIWGAWFGGLIMLFISVHSLFTTFSADHQTAGAAASGIFHQFNSIRLFFGAAALLLTLLWWGPDRTRMKLTLFALLVAGMAAATYVAMILTPTIEKMRVHGLTNTPEFRRLHGLSMMVYLMETVCVMIAGIALAQVRKPSRV